tara:strand:- start:1964 stop:2263 length:300 start_codon:yes stop_codon:yes gene_type:complete
MGTNLTMEKTLLTKREYLGIGNIARYNTNGVLTYKLVDNPILQEGMVGLTGGAHIFDNINYQLHENEYALNGETFFICHSKNDILVVEELPIEQLNIWL